MLELPPIPSLMPARDFNALSLHDLLDAREAAHVHLSRKDGVVGTAVGRYLIRSNDPNSKDALAVAEDKSKLGPRRLDNSVVTPWSWPCLLVFVRSWRESHDFRKDPENFISPSVDLPDGRQVPICVVEAAPDTAASTPMIPAGSSTGYYRGGLPVFSEVQSFDRFGTLGCLVTNGRAVYALTAAHVAGIPGTVAKLSPEPTSGVIGISDVCQIASKKFEKLYPTLPGKYVDSCIDAGLIRLDSIHNWSPAVEGIGAVGELFGIDMNTLSLSLIGTPVKAHGSGSGQIEGQILAFFYRYKALGGYDYVADLLIGPRTGGAPLATRPGDSGAIFFYDHVRAAADAEAARARSKARQAKSSDEEIERLAAETSRETVGRYAEAAAAGSAPPWRPLAMQWGGQRFFGAPASEESFPFALATSLGTACRALSVEIIRGWDIALPEYWGEVGHFTIGEVACDLLTGSTALRELFVNNRKNIGFSDTTISGGHVTGLGPGGFVPLADVPDDVWKKGATGVKRSKDNPTHYADMDEKGNHDKTLFDLCAGNPANITVALWTKHYDALGTDVSKRGSLPFRVRQIFEAMIEFVRAGDPVRYVCAAGILAHYVGDACQPLHGSRLANQNGVHSPYETTMLNESLKKNVKDVVSAVRSGLGGRKASASISSGEDAAGRVVDMMKDIRDKILSPEEIVQAWQDIGGPHSPDYSEMWAKLGAKTGQCMAEGALLLASLWQSAWEIGNGNATITTSAEVDYNKKLRPLFEPNGTTGQGTQFLPSFYLSDYPY